LQLARNERNLPRSLGYKGLGGRGV